MSTPITTPAALADVADIIAEEIVRSERLHTSDMYAMGRSDGLRCAYALIVGAASALGIELREAPPIPDTAFTVRRP